MDDILIKIGHRIRQIREGKNITQQDLAAMCNFEKSNMSRIESGKNNLTIYTLHKISKALSTTIAHIVDVE